MLSKQEAELNKLTEGAYIQSVVKGSPAELSGIQVGDVITSFDNKKVVAGTNDLSKLIASKKVGDKIAIIVQRNKQPVNLTATLAAAPTQ